jgi:hypothetical protein
MAELNGFLIRYDPGFGRFVLAKGHIPPAEGRWAPISLDHVSPEERANILQKYGQPPKHRRYPMDPDASSI